MSSLQPVFLIAFATCVVIGMFIQARVYRLMGQAFKLMEDRHPGHYRMIGEPLINGFKLRRVNKGGEYAMKLPFKGVPADTPNDIELIKLLDEAKRQYTITYWILLVAVIAWLGGFLTRS